MPKAKEPDPLVAVAAFVAQAEAACVPVYVGIDPGATGAIAFLCDRHQAVVDIPAGKSAVTRTRAVKDAEGKDTGKTRSVKGQTTLFDLPGIVALFRLLRPVKSCVTVCLEQALVQVQGGGATAFGAFKVGIAFGMWPLFLTSKGYAHEIVAPVVWKRKLGLIGKDKAAALSKARGLWPHAYLARAKDHNRAEALLLAEYLRREREPDTRRRR